MGPEETKRQREHDDRDEIESESFRGINCEGDEQNQNRARTAIQMCNEKSFLKSAVDKKFYREIKEEGI